MLRRGAHSSVAVRKTTRRRHLTVALTNRCFMMVRLRSSKLLSKLPQVTSVDSRAGILAASTFRNAKALVFVATESKECVISLRRCL